jgi:hypothetical protein
MTYQPRFPQARRYFGLPARDHEHLARRAGMNWWLRIKEVGLVDGFDPNFLNDV